jgi:hypothetical protein
MKATTNFSAPRPNLVPSLAMGLGVLALSVLIISIWFVVDAVELKKNKPNLEAQFAKLNSQRSGIAADPLPSHAELVNLKQRVALINTLSGNLGWPFPVLLAKLEQLLPDYAYLIQIHHKLDTGEIQMTVESESAEILTAFLVRLQKEEHFTEVLLTKQAQRAGQGRKRIQFDLRVKEKRG